MRSLGSLGFICERSSVMYEDQLQKKKLKITAGNTISAGERASFHTILNAYYQTPNLEIKIAVVALGSDIMHAAFTLAESDRCPLP